MTSASPMHRRSSEQLPHVRERALVPAGMTTVLPEATRHVRALESQLMSCCDRYGYDEIILPTFEYLDVLAPGLEPTRLENCYKIVDRTSGRILLLRPDVTAQIARTVGMGMVGAQLPLRLSYRAAVYRYEPEHAGRDREIFQVGAELIGAADPSADCEIITLMIECLQQADLRSFKVSLGHVGFFKRLLVRAGLSAAGQKQAEQAAVRKDLPRLEEILRQERTNTRSSRAILEALELCGQADVLAKGRTLAKGDTVLGQALDRLAAVYRLLCSTGFQEVILLDLGEFRGFDYYDGIVFDVFTEGIGVELGGGGRYDQLIGKFGHNIPSTGFALNVDRLFRGLNLSGTAKSIQPRTLVIAPHRLSARLVVVAQQLRQAGMRVIQRTIDSSGRGLMNVASRVGCEVGTDKTVVIGAEGTPPEHVVVLESPTTSLRNHGASSPGRLVRKTMSLEALISDLDTTHNGAR